MTEFTKDISDTVILTIKEINEKIRGLNFLETLKVNLFENLIKLINNYDFPIKENVKYELEVNQALRNIKISINYFMNSISITKKKIENDSLIFVLNEAANIDVYKDDKNFKSLLLYKNTGICLAKDTIINSKISKNTILLEIINKESEQILKN